MSKTKFKIGNIVSLKTNHLQKSDDYQNIWLSGDPNFTTPLMVISEISINTSQTVNEDNGKEKKPNRRIRYNCMYFSNKHLKFEENWFYEEELLKSKFKLSKKQKSKIKRNNRVVFKTNSIEAGKQKTFLELSNNRKTRKSSSLLTFTSPVFMVSGFPSIQKKVPEIDPITGQRKHIYPKKMVKIKFFNSLQDKFSEFTVPKESLVKVAEYNLDVLEFIINSKDKEKNNNPIFTITEHNEAIQVCTVDSIVFISDDYLINITELFTNKEGLIKLSSIKGIEQIELKKHKETYPLIKGQSEGAMSFSVKSISDGIKQLSEKSDKQNRSEDPMGEYLFHIGYTNRYNKHSQRYIIPYFSAEISTTEIDDKGKVNIVSLPYIFGYCLLKEETRYFKIDRMKSLQIEDNIKLFDAAKAIAFNDRRVLPSKEVENTENNGVTSQIEDSSPPEI